MTRRYIVPIHFIKNPHTFTTIFDHSPTINMSSRMDYELNCLKKQVEEMSRELRKTKSQLMKLQWNTNNNNVRTATYNKKKKRDFGLTSKKINTFFKTLSKCPMCQLRYSGSMQSHLNECLSDLDIHGDKLVDDSESMFKRMCIN